MFTGIINGLGTVCRLQSDAEDLVLELDTGELGPDALRAGDSLAVNGVCLTAREIAAGGVSFDVSAETLSRTCLGALRVGQRVNLELALLPTTRLGGHFVAGHVDGVGRVEALQRVSGSTRISLSAPARLGRYIAEKGSVCVDGVSLTINGVRDNEFDVNIVPHTWRATNMQYYSPGREVHIEVDLIARYLERLIDRSPDLTDKERITPEFLAAQGFLGPDKDV